MAVGDWWPFRLENKEDKVEDKHMVKNVSSTVNPVNPNMFYQAQQIANQQLLYQQQQLAYQCQHYNQSQSTYGIQQPVYITAGGAGGGGTGAYIGIVGAGNGTVGGQTSTTYTTYTPSQLPPYTALPLPSGRVQSVEYVGGNGFSVIIEIDEAYIPTINQISTMHRCKIQPVVFSKMEEGDFSFDEMEKAELLISEIDGENEESQEIGR